MAHYNDFLCIESSIFETEKTVQHVKPSHVHDVYFVRMCTKESEDLDILGKWMVFKHLDEIDDTWEKVRTAIACDELQGCHSAACTTMRYHPTLSGPGPDTSGVVCVYTEEHNMDAVGFKLIELVQQDIKYKTDADTLRYKYVHAGSGKTTIKTIFWNKGRPSFECEDRPCYGTSYKREDIWHLNIVEGMQQSTSGMVVHGRWVMRLEYMELTGLWHFLKMMIESETEKFGVIRMVCPPKHDFTSSTEKPEFHLYTSEETMKCVGMRLVKLVKRDLVFVFKPHRYNMPPRVKWLYWNDGEPDYERVHRKGITKNWRTGENVS